MDPDLKALLSALVEGQVKLSEGQATLAAAHARTERRLDGIELVMRQLAEEVVKLTEAQRRTEERLGWFGQQVTRGFTAVARRQGKIEKRVGKLERKV